MRIVGRAALAARRQAGRVARGAVGSVTRLGGVVPGLRSLTTSPTDPLASGGSRLRSLSGVAVIAPLIFAGAVGGTVQPESRVRDTAVTPLAAVGQQQVDRKGPSVVAAPKAPTALQIAATGTVSSPAPAPVVNLPGAMQIPPMALAAYRNAERIMAATQPECGISWNLLAGIGRIESMHAYGGATDARGNAVRPIYGPLLDGSLPGNEIIVESRDGDRVTYARAMGPMQFLPGTWARYASDGDGDGKADVQNIYDAALAAARYLCSGGLNLRDPSHVMTAILRYNNSVAYARNVLGWAAAYATGIAPIDLPPITGEVPTLEAAASGHGLGDPALEKYEGLGPGLPFNALGLPPTDPLSRLPILGRGDVASQIPGFAPGQRLGPLPGPAPGPEAPPALPQPETPPWLPPWLQPQPQRPPGCAVFCIQDRPAPLQPVPTPDTPVQQLTPPLPGTPPGPAPGPDVPGSPGVPSAEAPATATEAPAPASGDAPSPGPEPAPAG